MPTLPAQHLLEGTAGSRVPYFRHSYTRQADHSHALCQALPTSARHMCQCSKAIRDCQHSQHCMTHTVGGSFHQAVTVHSTLILSSS